MKGFQPPHYYFSSSGICFDFKLAMSVSTIHFWSVHCHMLPLTLLINFLHCDLLYETPLILVALICPYHISSIISLQNSSPQNVPQSPLALIRMYVNSNPPLTLNWCRQKFLGLTHFSHSIAFISLNS